MSTLPRSRLPEALRRVIDGYRRRWRAIHAQTGLLVTLGVLACMVGLGVAADRLLRLSPTLRAIALAVIVGASALCLVGWVIWPAVRRMRDLDAAARLGHHYPAVEEDLVSAVELSAENLDEQGVSHGLIASALRHISARARTVNYRAAVPVRPLLKAGLVVLGVLALLFAAYQVRPEAFRNALARLFRPAAAVPFFSYTKLSVEPGDCVVRVGDSLDVVVTTSGRPAALARLYGRRGDGSEPSDALFVRLACEKGVGRWTTGPLFKDISYRVSAGDAISDWRRIRVVPPPSLSRKGARLIAPRYAGGRQRVIESVEGPLPIVQGTEVVLVATPVNRGSEPELQCTGQVQVEGRSVPLAADGSGILASPPLTPQKSGECVIALVDGFGLRNRTAESVFVRVTPDRVPVITLAKPGRDLLILASEPVPVEALARDEFGIRALTLHYRIIKRDSGESAERWEKRVLKEGGPETAELAATTELNVVQLGLVPGDILEYEAEASDYADEAVLRRGKSPVYRITVLSETEHLALILGKLKELQLEMLRRAAGQKAQAGQADRLAKSADKAGVNDAARAAQNQELDQARATENLARKLEDLLPELARNPSTPTDMLAEMQRLSKGVESVAHEPMQQAADDFGRAAESPPSQEGQQGEPTKGGQQSQNGQQSPSQQSLRMAQQHAEEAARRLEQLAQVAERLQRRTLLEQLAAQAEALAARQRGLKDNLLPLARETLGSDASDITPEQKGRLERLVAAQRSVQEGTHTLTKDIEKASATLAFSNPNDAATAEQGRRKLEDDKVAQRAGAIARRIEGNALFAQVPEQEGVAQSLLAVADILRRGVGEDLLDSIAREIEEFIRRQKEINGHIEVAIRKDEKALRPPVLGGEQSNLQRDVSEQASALQWLAKEVAAFRSATADKLDAAASEMGQGATDLYAKALPEGLEHGKKALALLEDAREQFKSDRQQMQQMAMDAQMMQAMLLLARCLLGQKRVNATTVEAEKLRLREHEQFNDMAVGIAKNQSNVRVDAKRLEGLIKRFPVAAALVAKSGEKMDVSRIAVGAGDTGKETREVQRMALALLEKLLSDPQGMGGGGGGAGMQAMMGMMAGGSPGGFAGGTNGPVEPARPTEAKSEDWRRVRSRFDEQLGAAFEGHFPADYRPLLNAYFDRLRKEPVR